MTFWAKQTPMKRSPIKRTEFGAKEKARVQWESQQARTLEGSAERLGLFSLHHIDWVHFEVVRTSRGTLKAGYPDYFLIGTNWSAYLEIKARNELTGKMSSYLSPAQHTFHDKLRAVGAEVWTAYLPDDLQAVNLWLRDRTGVICGVDGMMHD